MTREPHCECSIVDKIRLSLVADVCNRWRWKQTPSVSVELHLSLITDALCDLCVHVLVCMQALAGL